MTVGARLRSQVAGSLPRRGRRGRGRGRRAGDEEPIVEQLELDDAAAESSARPGTRSARRVHLAVLPERYEPLEEPVPAGPGDKPKRRYRQKLKKYGKNVGKAIAKGCHYVVLGLQGFAAAYSAPFAVATSVVSFVR
ncbi:required for drug-induced death protein 1 [Eptesicus fuscus]|uniref:required for drug-induced death protein 1 n=1 Tax=Eptesicus fuscus TaxID=29078 RepID=UPI002403EDB4|nr:required for drug-induced death protein 1 [Eptesicus fuscus]